MNEEMINITTHTVDKNILMSIHGTPEETWLDFIVTD
jgi:hypothetical protein